MFNKFSTLIVLAACVHVYSSVQAVAQAQCDEFFAGQRYTLIIPSRAGGGYDAYGRAFAPVFREVTGAKMIVSNLPAGGGLVAIKTVAEAEADDNLMVFTGTGKMFSQDPGRVDPNTLRTLAAAVVDEEVFMSRHDEPLERFTSTPWIIGASTYTSSASSGGLVGLAMGVHVDLVAGYGGSTDTKAAALRGEIDIISQSIGTARLTVASTDLRMVLTLTNGPAAGAEGVPYLAGEGGVIDLLTRDLPESERKERMELADTAVALNTQVRTFLTGHNTQGQKLDCLRTAVYSVLGGDDFVAAMNALKRPLSPLDYAAAETLIDQVGDAHKSSAHILAEIIARYQN